MPPPPPGPLRLRLNRCPAPLRTSSAAFSAPEGPRGAGPPSGPTSHGRAAAELVKMFRTKKARMGERSRVPPMGGMMPRKRFRYGSASVDRGPAMA